MCRNLVIIGEPPPRLVFRASRPRAVPRRPPAAILERFNQGEFAHPFSHGVSHDRVTLATRRFAPNRGHFNRDRPPRANFSSWRMQMEAIKVSTIMDYGGMAGLTFAWGRLVCISLIARFSLHARLQMGVLKWWKYFTTFTNSWVLYWFNPSHWFLRHNG